MNTTSFDCVIRQTGLALCLLTFASSPAFAKDEVTTYKKLSLQELMDIEVTSVSRRPEKLSDTASAIQVITGDDVRRSGATSIPEALRLATNLLHGGYTLLREDIRVKAGQADLNNALNETADPRHQFSLRSSIDLPHHLEFETGIRWVDALRLNNNGAEAKVPGCFELDIRLAWHPTPGIELSLAGQNLLHDPTLRAWLTA